MRKHVKSNRQTADAMIIGYLLIIIATVALSFEMAVTCLGVFEERKNDQMDPLNNEILTQSSK